LFGFLRKLLGKKQGDMIPILFYGFEDWDFWIELLKNSSKKVIRMNYLGFYYRRKDVSRDVNINKNLSQKRRGF
jgi:hypothetical protein